MIEEARKFKPQESFLEQPPETVEEDIQSRFERQRAEAYGRTVTFKQQLRALFDDIIERYAKPLTSSERIDLDKLTDEADVIYRRFLESTEPVHKKAEKLSLGMVVGGSERQRVAVETASDVLFSDQEFEAFKAKEREKTPEDQYIIALVNQEIKLLRQKYGVKPLEISEKNIHFIKPSAWPLQGSEGGFNAHSQAILIRDTRVPLDKAHYVFHESVHAASFFSMNIDSTTAAVWPRRKGLIIIEKDGREHFDWLNEAVTEELSKRFIEKNEDDLIFRKSILTREFILPLKRFNYPEERKALQLLCEELSNRLPERFDSPEEAFDLFARSMFTGEIIELGRVIEHAFGKGSFRRLRRPQYGKSANQLIKRLLKKPKPT